MQHGSEANGYAARRAERTPNWRRGAGGDTSPEREPRSLARATERLSAAHRGAASTCATWVIGSSSANSTINASQSRPAARAARGDDAAVGDADRASAQVLNLRLCKSKSPSARPAGGGTRFPIAIARWDLFHQSGNPGGRRRSSFASTLAHSHSNPAPARLVIRNLRASMGANTAGSGPRIPRRMQSNCNRPGRGAEQLLRFCGPPGNRIIGAT